MAQQSEAEEDQLHPLFQPGLPLDFCSNTTLLAIANVEVVGDDDDVGDDDARLKKDFRRKRRTSGFSISQPAASLDAVTAPPRAHPGPPTLTSSSSFAGPLRASAHAKRTDKGSAPVMTMTSSNPFRKHLPRAGRLEIAPHLKPIVPRLHHQSEAAASSFGASLKNHLAHASPLMSAKPRVLVDTDTGVLSPAPPLLDLRAVAAAASSSSSAAVPLSPAPPTVRNHGASGAGAGAGADGSSSMPPGLASAPGRLSRGWPSAAPRSANRSPGMGAAHAGMMTANSDGYGPLAGPDPEVASLTLFMKVWRPNSVGRGDDSPASLPVVPMFHQPTAAM